MKADQFLKQEPGQAVCLCITAKHIIFLQCNSVMLTV